jgi:hypothetical protein
MSIFEKFKRRKKDFVDEIIAKLGCDCWILEEKELKDIMNRYHQALKQGKQEGFTPLIIIPSEMMLEIVDTEAEKGYPTDNRESILAKAKNIDAKELLKSRIHDAKPEDDDDDEDIAGEFTISDQTDHFLSIEDSINKKILIAKIPTDQPWEVAAWIPMGGFNECPLPEEQVAVFKYWHEKYGATPALVTEDVWEFFVQHPPHTQEESESLAWEQFGFCGDIVWQGVGTVNALAGTLINSSVWYFWWD